MRHQIKAEGPSGSVEDLLENWSRRDILCTIYCDHKQIDGGIDFLDVCLCCDMATHACKCFDPEWYNEIPVLQELKVLENKHAKFYWDKVRITNKIFGSYIDWETHEWRVSPDMGLAVVEEIDKAYKDMVWLKPQIIYER